MPLPPNRVDYSPIIDRPRIEWPDGARVAFWGRTQHRALRVRARVRRAPKPLAAHPLPGRAAVWLPGITATEWDFGACSRYSMRITSSAVSR